MEELFVRPRALMRMREGPLGVCVDTFIDSLAAKGYSRDSRRRAAWLVGDFSRWLVTVRQSHLDHRARDADDGVH